MRAVLDTGVLVSALIRKGSTPGAVLDALRNERFTAIYSTEIMLEVVDVLNRAKFRTKYHVQPDDSIALINLIRLRGELVNPAQVVAVCRDPKDDKFLAAALAGQADCVVSGNDDSSPCHPTSCPSPNPITTDTLTSDVTCARAGGSRPRGGSTARRQPG